MRHGNNKEPSSATIRVVISFWWYKRRKKHRHKHKFWVMPIFQLRREYGQFYTLFFELKLQDREIFIGNV